MTNNSNTATAALATLSVVRKETRAMKVVSTETKTVKTNNGNGRTIISSKGYISAPKHDFL